MYHELHAARPSLEADRSSGSQQISSTACSKLRHQTPNIAPRYATANVPAAPHVNYPTARRNTADDTILKI